MNSKYDLYKQLSGNRLLWIHRVKELHEARQLVAAMQSVSADHYLLYDYRERAVVEVFRPQIARLGEAA